MDINTNNSIVRKEEQSEMWMSSTLQMEVPLQSQLTISQLIDVPIAVQLNPTSFNLPHNWVVEQRYRNSPKYANISDKVFSIFLTCYVDTSFKVYFTSKSIKYVCIFYNF